MVPEIHSKLSRLFRLHVPFTEESQVVYLLVEVRKILDRKDDRSFPLLRFYADWSVHTAKDKITPEIQTIMRNVYKEIQVRQARTSFVDTAPTIIPFVSMMELRTEFDRFLQKYELPDDLVIMKNWQSLQGLLASILADQPINEPCDGIHEFAYKPAADGCVIVEIEYEKASGVHDTFRLEGGN